MPFRRPLHALAAAALTAACAARHAPDAAPPRALVITRAEIAASRLATPIDVVKRLRPEWLLTEGAATRGPDTLLPYAELPRRTVGVLYVDERDVRGRDAWWIPPGVDRGWWPIGAVTRIRFLPPSTIVVYGSDSAAVAAR